MRAERQRDTDDWDAGEKENKKTSPEEMVILKALISLWAGRERAGVENRGMLLRARFGIRYKT